MTLDDSQLDFAAAFESTGSGRSDRWQLVQSIAEAFWGPILPEHQVDDSELDKAEARLGIRLPPALREGYQLLGAHPNVSAQDHLLPPAEFTLQNSDLVRFRGENQGCADWACRVGQDDPPMSVRIAGGSWQPDAGPVSEFFVHMVLSEILLTARFADNGPADDERIARLEGAASWLPVAPFVFWPGPDLPSRRFFGGPGVLVGEDARTWIWVAALTQDRLDSTRNDLRGEWNMDPDTD